MLNLGLAALTAALTVVAVPTVQAGEVSPGERREIRRDRKELRQDERKLERAVRKFGIDSPQARRAARELRSDRRELRRDARRARQD